MVDNSSGIQSLIERLKSDGVNAGQSQKKEIIAEAQSEAKRLLESAKLQAEQMLADCKVKHEKLKREFESELRLAARDFLINFKTQISKDIIQPQTAKKVSEAFLEPRFMKENLEKSISEFIQHVGGTPRLFLSEDLKTALSAELLQALQDKFTNGDLFEIKLLGGQGIYKLLSKNGKLSWEVSIDTLVEAFSRLMEPKLVQFLLPDMNSKLSTEALSA